MKARTAKSSSRTMPSVRGSVRLRRDPPRPASGCAAGCPRGPASRERLFAVRRTSMTRSRLRCAFQILLAPARTTRLQQRLRMLRIQRQRRSNCARRDRLIGVVVAIPRSVLTFTFFGSMRAPRGTIRAASSSVRHRNTGCRAARGHRRCESRVRPASSTGRLGFRPVQVLLAAARLP